ncbi:DUF1203 domain-containing protein [Luteimonas terricola]|uniref:DUF1203 domain-containing protein n=1 Tax=Luteimonas terricola TaxID=645597 RepID=UPI0027E57BF3|nr:DUF1203 domain-containing protein [Luteimonas terricola]
MLSADVQDGSGVTRALEKLFTDHAVSYVHLHNARQGCFPCHARRVQPCLAVPSPCGKS